LNDLLTIATIPLPLEGAVQYPGGPFLNAELANAACQASAETTNTWSIQVASRAVQELTDTLRQQLKGVHEQLRSIPAHVTSRARGERLGDEQLSPPDMTPSRFQPAVEVNEWFSSSVERKQVEGLTQFHPQYEKQVEVLHEKLNQQANQHIMEIIHAHCRLWGDQLYTFYDLDQSLTSTGSTGYEWLLLCVEELVESAVAADEDKRRAKLKRFLEDLESLRDHPLRDDWLREFDSIVRLKDNDVVRVEV